MRAPGPWGCIQRRRHSGNVGKVAGVPPLLPGSVVPEAFDGGGGRRACERRQEPAGIGEACARKPVLISIGVVPALLLLLLLRQRRPGKKLPLVVRVQADPRRPGDHTRTRTTNTTAATNTGGGKGALRFGKHPHQGRLSELRRPRVDRAADPATFCSAYSVRPVVGPSASKGGRFEIGPAATAPAAAGLAAGRHHDRGAWAWLRHRKLTFAHVAAGSDARSAAAHGKSQRQVRKKTSSATTDTVAEVIVLIIPQAPAPPPPSPENSSPLQTISSSGLATNISDTLPHLDDPSPLLAESESGGAGGIDGSPPTPPTPIPRKPREPESNPIKEGYGDREAAAAVEEAADMLMFSPQGIKGGRAAIFAAAVELNCGVVRRRGGDGVGVGDTTPAPAPARARPVGGEAAERSLRGEAEVEEEARCLCCCLARFCLW